MNFLTTDQVAEKLQMNRKVIERKTRAGEIPAYKIGKEWRYVESEVEEFVLSKKHEPDDSVREIVADVLEGFKDHARRTAAGTNGRMK